jgi:8-oxo-dGTP pyrophosphatase MutT (NUDIX family)
MSETPPKAAGIMFRTPEGAVLLMKRAATAGDYPGHWALPAGHIEAVDDSSEATARREAQEETGYTHDGELSLLHKTDDFHTFLADDVAPFPVTMNDEHDGYVWALPSDLPQPLHPGVADPLAVAGIENELHVAELIMQGVLPSPQRFANVWLWDIRITGTGTSYRTKGNEYVFRPPENYLTAMFLQRCNGLSVIIEHPKDATLDSQEFKDRAVGSVFLPYVGDGIRHDASEVWAIAKIYDDAAAAIMSDPDNPVSTSPSVVFEEITDNTKITLDSGEALLIEGIPALLDHIAICEHGVWDKGGAPSGVNSTNKEFVMTDAELKAKADAEAAAKKRADEEGGKLDMLLDGIKVLNDGMGSLTKRMDAFEAKNADSESEEEKEKKAKADAEIEAKAKADAEEAEAKKKADAEEVEAKKKADEDAERPAMADAQAKCDSVMANFGEQAPRAMQGENLLSYRRRLVTKLQKHSTAWSKVDLSRADAATLDVAESQIYADAVQSARRGGDVAEGVLLEIKQADSAGRMVSTFRGHPRVWLNQFKLTPRGASNFKTKH